MLGLKVTTYTQLPPPPLLILLGFFLSSSSISVCLICLPDGITNILNPEYSLSITMPFKQDCYACPFVIITGKKGPRDAQIGPPRCQTYSFMPIFCEMAALLPDDWSVAPAKTMTPPLARWFKLARQAQIPRLQS